MLDTVNILAKFLFLHACYDYDTTYTYHSNLSLFGINVTMVTASNVTKTILQQSIHRVIVKSCSQTKNKLPIAHNNLISVQCLYNGVLVHSHWYHSNNTKYLR